MFLCLFFQVPYADLGSRTLIFSIFDFDRFSKHDDIGQVKVAMNSVDLGRVVDCWADLQIPDKEADKVMMSLTHVFVNREK